MFIVRPNLEESALKEVVKTFESVLTKNGAKIEASKDMGQKELAYEIKDHKSGYYFLYDISCADDKAQKEFDRLANLSEDIIRHMIIKL
jgi:small subunit ribosomal protein S6